jgi:hypothetical protein
VELANCIAVKAVVASSTRRRCVMMIEIPGKVLAAEKIQQPNGSVSDQRPAIGPDCGGR